MRRKQRTEPRILSRIEKRFLQYLKFHRMVAGKTQEKLAKEVGISQGHYCDIERGRVKPHPVIHKRLCEALNRPIEEFTAKLYGVNAADMVTQPASVAK
jgi:DNA-binding XRE family transcriptional regulator